MNFLGALGALGRLLPGYVQGREAAIRGNWNDLNQFNQVQAGQLQNLFTEETYPLAYNRAVDDAALSRMMTQEHTMNQFLPSMFTGAPRLASAMATAYGNMALVPNATRAQASNLGTQMSNNWWQQNTNALNMQNALNQMQQNSEMGALMRQYLPNLLSAQQGSAVNGGAPTAAATEENIRQGLNP